MQREVTPGEVASWLLALLGGGAAFCWAFLLFFADREQRAVVFVAGGLALVFWAAGHLTHERRRHH